MKIKITSLFLATILALSQTGCSLKKDNDNKEITYQNEQSFNDEYKTRMIKFIEKIEQSNLNLDLDNFYNNAKTLKILAIKKVEDQHYNSFYDKLTNTIYMNLDDKGALEHELIHVLMNNGKEFNNTFLEEGYVELLTSEICDSENTYKFNVGVLKILTTILGRDTIFDAFNNKDKELIINGLANIKPEYQDAKEVLQYLDYEHKLLNAMHEEFYNVGNLDNFKKTDDYQILINVRSDLTERFKIYIKNYYRQKMNTGNYEPKKLLTEMLAILDIVDKELFDPDLEINRKNDFFLKEEVGYLKQVYNISDTEYDECYQNSKELKFLYQNNNNINKTK